MSIMDLNTVANRSKHGRCSFYVEGVVGGAAGVSSGGVFRCIGDGLILMSSTFPASSIKSSRFVPSGFTSPASLAGAFSLAAVSTASCN